MSQAPVATSTLASRSPRTCANGLVYHISFTATDTFGASCSGTVLVGVQHDQRGDAGVDDGPVFDSTT